MVDQDTSTGYDDSYQTPTHYENADWSHWIDFGIADQVVISIFAKEHCTGTDTNGLLAAAQSYSEDNAFKGLAFWALGLEEDDAVNDCPLLQSASESYIP